jgi:hypothetical protein
MLLFDFSHNNFQLSVTGRRDFVTNSITALTVHVKNPANSGHTAGFPFEIAPGSAYTNIEEIRAAILNWSELDNIVQTAAHNFSVLPPADPN